MNFFSLYTSKGFDLLKDDVIELLDSNDTVDTLLSVADTVRRVNVGEEIHLRALIEFSNICYKNCLYCGLRSANKTVSRYFLEPDYIISLAESAKRNGYKTVVLQSGENIRYNIKEMVYMLENIKKTGIAITLSVGEKSRDEYAVYKNAGADRFLLRIETTDQALYAKMHPGADFHNRLKCLYDLKELGYEVGTGCLVGLPGQTIESLANDILFFKEIDADMVGIGPFIPSPNTSLSDSQGGSLLLSLKVLALTRLMLPTANIPATTAMETLHKDGQIMALNCGANVIMPNVTGCDYSSKYTIYPDKAKSNTIESAVKMVHSIGRTVSKSYGHRRKV